MIKIYCNHHHKNTGETPEKTGQKPQGDTENPLGLCGECLQLYEYACRRSDKCPFMESKTFCSNCPVHCYKPRMRDKIRKVMAFSGPRMIFHHPIMALSHVIESKKEKNRLKKEN